MLWDNLLVIRAQAPLVPDITNRVVMSSTAHAPPAPRRARWGPG